jgi:endoglucanase
MMAETSIELLKSLTQADGIPGYEAEVRAIFRDKLSDVGTIGTDRLGSIFCTRAGNAEHPRILVDSHLDEIGFVVQSVTDNGFVKFLPLGGWWAHTLLAQRVTITTKLGKVPGVIGSTPPHLLSGSRDKVLDLKDLFIDIGAENEEQAMEEFGVLPGCPIAPYGPFMPLKNDKLFSAKAFDNRVGVALVIESLLGLDEHPNTVIGAGSVQEEIGLRGARTVAASVEPDLAIVLEGPPADDTPGLNVGATQGKLGGGVQIRLIDSSMIVNPKLADFVIETAKRHEIPYQLGVRQSGGTDGGAIHQSGIGVPSVVLGVPSRYIHSHVSIINIDDYTAALELTKHLVCEIDASVLEGFLFD